MTHPAGGSWFQEQSHGPQAWRVEGPQCGPDGHDEEDVRGGRWRDEEDYRQGLDWRPGQEGMISTIFYFPCIISLYLNILRIFSHWDLFHWCINEIFSKWDDSLKKFWCEPLFRAWVEWVDWETFEPDRSWWILWHFFNLFGSRHLFFFLFLVESFYSNQRVCRHKIIWSNLVVLRLRHLPTTQQWSSEEVEQDKPRLVQLHFLDIFHLYNRIFWNKDTSEMLCFDKTISTCCVMVVDLSQLLAVISTVVVVLYWSPREREEMENSQNIFWYPSYGMVYFGVL